MKKITNEKIQEIYATYMKAREDMFCILQELVEKKTCYSPQYDERINAAQFMDNMQKTRID